MVDPKGDLAKSTIEDLRGWNESLRFAGFSNNLADLELCGNDLVSEEITGT
jgi:hypothetical protein